MILQISLLSDLCASSGEHYNSYVDTDVVYDEFGLPFIPAKRIKGCIREAALELVEWGIFEKQVYDSLFGKEGNEKSKFSLDNAYLKEYENLTADLKNCQDKVLVHPQRVLGLYAYTRTQTAMTKDGVADKGSLRTIRVINKGLIFQAALKETVKLTEEEKNLLKTAVSMVKHMGTGRTRGLGLVELTFPEEKKEGSKDENKKKYELGEWNKIHYTINLKSAVLCKSAAGTQEKTHDYIEGSKILGILAQNLSKEEFARLMQYDGTGKSIIASNAYICEKGERCTPVRASLQKKKDQTFDKKGEMLVADMLVPNEEDVQWTPIGNKYMNAEGTIKSVDVEVNYHHRRPKDKAVGKANGLDDSAFYQLESICRGQQFSGFLLADREQTELIISVFENLDGVRIGAGSNAEYGNADIVITNTEHIEKTAPKMEHEFVIKLNAPVILYNKQGMPVADIACLKSYLAELLEVEEHVLQINQAFLTYETIGGFNVTWHRRKPIFTALGKGTVCSVTAMKEVDISRLEHVFIGERVAEGYGELEVSSAPKARVVVKKAGHKSSEDEEQEKTGVQGGIIGENQVKTDILSRLYAEKQREDLSRAGVSGADELLEKEAWMFAKREFKAALGKLLMIVKAESTMENIREQVLGIESNAKKEICVKLLDKVEMDLNRILTEQEKKEVFKYYLYSFLNQIKYKTYKKGEKVNE